MTDTLITQILILSALAILIGWNVYVAFFNKIPNRKDTISGNVMAAALKLPSVGFALGVLLGHWLWPGKPLFGQPLSVVVLAAIGVVLTVVGLFFPVRIVPIAWGALGILGGHLFWPM